MTQPWLPPEKEPDGFGGTEFVQDDAADDRQSIGKNVAQMMSSQVFTWTLATFAAIIMPRFLQPASLGDLRLATSLWLIAGTVSALGTSEYLQLEVARNSSRGLSTVGPILVVRSLAFIVSAAALAVYVALTAESTEFVIVMAIIGVATLFSSWAEVFSTAFVGLERMAVPALANAGTKVVAAGGSIILLILGAGLYGVAGASMVAAVASTIYLIWRFRAVGNVSLAEIRSHAWRVAKSSRTYMAATISLVAYRQIDVVVISWVADREDLGWYGLADTVFGTLLFPATILIGTLFPTLGRLFAEDPKELERLVTKTSAGLFLLGVPIGLGTALVAPEFAPVFFGEDYRETGIVLAVFGPVIVLTFGTIVFGTVALTTERGQLWVYVILAAAALTIPLDLVLVPWADDVFDNGAVGGAIAYTITEGLQFLIGLFVVARYLLNRTFVWRSVRVLVAGAIMLGAGWLSLPLPIPVTILLSVIVYVAAVVVLRILDHDERRLVGVGFDRIRRR